MVKIRKSWMNGVILLFSLVLLEFNFVLDKDCKVHRVPNQVVFLALVVMFSGTPGVDLAHFDSLLH